MKLSKRLLLIASLLAAFTTGTASHLGLLGGGEYIRNYEAAEYDPDGNYPAPTMIIDGLAIYTLGEGEPVLLFPYPHAGTDSPMVQSDLAEILAGLGRMVITFDVPGAYASTREPDVSMAEMHNCAEEALAALGIHGPLDVVGHSMGGLAALGYALEYPGQVKRLLLINALSGFDASLEWGIPGSAWTWTEPEYWQMIYWGLRLNNGHANLAIHKKMLNLFAQVSYHDPQYIHLYQIEEDDYQTPTPVRFLWSNAVWNINYADRLSEVTAPTLITGARYDPQTPPPCTEELAAGIPDNQMVMFENSGHSPFVEETEKFTQVITDFLAP